MELDCEKILGEGGVVLKFFKMYGMINKTYVLCWSIKCWKKIQRSEFTSSYVTQEIQQIEAKNKNNK